MAKKTIAKLKVYLESTISGYATARPTSNVDAAVKQAYTIQWVEKWMKKCDCYVSRYVIAENRNGDEAAAQRRLEFNRQASYLDVDVRLTTALAQKLIRPDAIPENQMTDALHVAIAVLGEMDVLLTWNCNHINNPVTLPKVLSEIERAGYRPPLILTPQQFIEAYQSNRRPINEC